MGLDIIFFSCFSSKSQGLYVCVRRPSQQTRHIFKAFGATTLVHLVTLAFCLCGLWARLEVIPSRNSHQEISLAGTLAKQEGHVYAHVPSQRSSHGEARQ